MNVHCLRLAYVRVKRNGIYIYIGVRQSGGQRERKKYYLKDFVLLLDSACPRLDPPMSLLFASTVNVLCVPFTKAQVRVAKGRGKKKHGIMIAEVCKGVLSNLCPLLGPQ